MLEFSIERMPSAVGDVIIVTDAENRLRAVDFPEYESRMFRLFRLHYGEHGYTLTSARKQSTAKDAMRAYFDGDLTAIDALKTATGGTVFQRSVWSSLRDIPAGETISYGQLAARIGLHRASRAVGLANGANPIAIVVPCHRVVGANGSLTGYGGGIERKRWLLAHEASA